MIDALIIAALGLLLFISLVFSYITRRYYIPDVLLLFIVGLILGPLTGLIDIQLIERFGQLFALIALSIILFEAGLRMKLGALWSSLGGGLSLIFLNLAATIVIVAGISVFLFDMPLAWGIAIGTILGSTSAAVIIPLIQNLGLSKKTQSLLKVESILNNIVVIVLVVAAMEALTADSFSLLSAIRRLITVFTLSIIWGGFWGWIWPWVLMKLRGLHNTLFATPALILVIFGLAEWIGANGAIAVFVFGITLANLKDSNLSILRLLSKNRDFYLAEKEKTLFSSLAFLLKTYFFIFMGISINFSEPLYILWGAFIAIALLLLRWGIFETFFHWALPEMDRFIVKIMYPKGLTESALLVLIGSQFLSQLAYPVIMFSIIYTSILVFYARFAFRTKEPMALEKLESAEPDTEEPSVALPDFRP